MALTVTDILKFRESENDPWQRLLLQANINFNLIYPVGSIYMSTVNVDPATLFGGTWEQLEDRFLLGAGTTYTAGDTGGEAEHTLIESEMPSHTHGIKANSSNSEANGYGLTQTGAFQNRVLVSRSSADMVSTSTGGNGAHNNMPPYIVVYMWKRLTLSPSLTPLPMNVLGDVASQDIVPVSMGGTGANNAADARTNLGLLYAEKVDLGSLSLSASGADTVIVPNTIDVAHYCVIPVFTNYPASGVRQVTLTPMQTSGGIVIIAKNQGSAITVNISAWVIHVP